MSEERKEFEKQFHSLYLYYHRKHSGFRTREAIFMN